MKRRVRCKVRFLVLQKIRREIPIEILARLLPAQFKYLNDLEREGKIDACMHLTILIGQQGNLLIVNVNSVEELSRVISEDPLLFHSEREVYPLTTREPQKNACT